MKPLQILDYFRDRQANVLDLIHEIVEIETPTRDVAGSQTVTTFLERTARTISKSFEIEMIFAEGYGEHFILRTFASGEKPILLLGHTDTVHPRASFKNNPTRIENDKFYGCGIFDMKGNCVLTLEILRLFSELNLKPPRPITILLSCDEEIGSPTGRALVEREARNAAFCLVCEPSAGGKVKTGRKGTGTFNLKVRGVPAHAGLEPERGASAILEISRQIEKLHSLNNFDSGTTVTVGTVRGGTTSNVVPAEAECAIDIRFRSMSEAERIADKIKNLNSFDERTKLEITGAINRPPMERTENVVNLYEKARNIALQLNYDLGETQVGGASDGNFVGALGVPVLDGLGIAGDGAHTLEEYIFIDDIPKRAALLALLLLAD
jgi:glutamate carboxypeptidase